MGYKRKNIEKICNKKTFEFLRKTVSFARFKIIKNTVPQLKPDALNATFLPINQDIELPESNAVPLALLNKIIEKASCRVIVDYCLCRTAMECERHSKKIGCLMMGRGAKDIDPSIGHTASVEEAKEHAKKAVMDGLVPLVGKSLVENMVFGISKENRDRFFVACFCCSCCCISRFFKPLPPGSRKENLIKIEGLQIEVGSSCTGCVKCAQQCFVGAIHITGGKAVIDEGCLGCGRCATICPVNAVKISIHNTNYMEDVLRRLEAVVDVG